MLILTIIPVAVVMAPAMYRFYTEPDALFLSSISITQIVRTAVSIPDLITAAIYAFGKLPVDVKKSIWWTAALWVASMVLGAVLFLQMMELIPVF